VHLVYRKDLTSKDGRRGRSWNQIKERSGIAGDIVQQCNQDCKPKGSDHSETRSLGERLQEDKKLSRNSRKETRRAFELAEHRHREIHRECVKTTRREVRVVLALCSPEVRPPCHDIRVRDLPDQRSIWFGDIANLSTVLTRRKLSGCNKLDLAATRTEDFVACLKIVPVE